MKLGLIEACNILERSPSTLANWRRGGAPGFEMTPARRVLVDVTAVREWAQNQGLLRRRNLGRS